MNKDVCSRRTFLKYSGLAAAGAVLPGFLKSCGSSESGRTMYVGTYTSGESVGIYRCRFASDSGILELLGETPEVTDPSYLAIAPNNRFLYTVNEIDNFRDMPSGAVSAFAIDAKSGALSFLNQFSSHGAFPCYISLDNAGRHAYVANYNGGNVVAFPITEDGYLSEAIDLWDHEGSGPNPDRQTAPHAHCILPDPENRYALSADLGIDKIMIYRIDRQTGELTPNDPASVSVEAGAGPRHIAFHSDGEFVYVINELNSTITAFSYSSQQGMLTEIQTVQALPQDFDDHNQCADIHISSDGRYLYGSNRGHNSIVVFSIDSSTGLLDYVEHVSTQGDWPRNFVLTPGDSHLLVANQESNNITVFQRDQRSGTLMFTGQSLELPSPVCLKFL